MTPSWDLNLQKEAKALGKILVPGVFTPYKIQSAIKCGYKIIKLFPASSVEKNYIKKVRGSQDSFPFVVAAGGIKAKDINMWLHNGFNSVAIGKELIRKSEIDPFLIKWLLTKQK